jgi:hypothetical protein
MPAKPDPMIRKNYFLPEKIIAALEKRAAQSGTNVSEHVRRALIEYLKLEAQ